MTTTKRYNYKKLKDVFFIDHTSPSNLSWNIDIQCAIHNNVLKVKKGDHCKHLASNGRYVVMYEGRSYMIHRIVWLLTYKELKNNDIVDHINGDPTDNKIENLRVVCSKLNARNTVRDKTPEAVQGIQFRIVNGYEYWVARWSSLAGKQNAKFFSVTKLGFNKAKNSAIIYRLGQLKLLNEQGAGYTDRHINQTLKGIK